MTTSRLRWAFFLRLSSLDYWQFGAQIHLPWCVDCLATGDRWPLEPRNRTHSRSTECVNRREQWLKRYSWRTIQRWPKLGTGGVSAYDLHTDSSDVPFCSFKVGLDSASIEVARSMTRGLVEWATRREEERNLWGGVPVCHGPERVWVNKAVWR